MFKISSLDYLHNKMSEKIFVVIIQEWNEIETENRYILITTNAYGIFNSTLKDNISIRSFSKYIYYRLSLNKI